MMKTIANTPLQTLIIQNKPNPRLCAVALWGGACIVWFQLIHSTETQALGIKLLLIVFVILVMWWLIRVQTVIISFDTKEATFVYSALNPFRKCKVLPLGRFTCVYATPHPRYSGWSVHLSGTKGEHLCIIGIPSPSWWKPDFQGEAAIALCNKITIGLGIRNGTAKTLDEVKNLPSGTKSQESAIAPPSSQEKSWEKGSIQVILLSCFLCFSSGIKADAASELKDFLKKNQSFRANFTQTVKGKKSRDPLVSTGIVLLERPGKLRWQIDSPMPQLVVGNGKKIWIYDPELQQVTVREAGHAIGSSPMALLTEKDALQKNFNLQVLPDDEGLSWVRAIPKPANHLSAAEENDVNGGFEKILLGLSVGQLRRMVLFDAFGQETEIRLENIESNPRLSADLFHFVPPPLSDVIDDTPKKTKAN